jgi:8-oxo-dGTP pyrophosphatase MutT (NUDIX family)
MKLNYYQSLNHLISKTSSPLVKKFITRINKHKISRTENPASHVCCFFALIDTRSQQVFLGHHKKSNLWLFNGGHIEKNELPVDTIAREMLEEWGYQPLNPTNIKPDYLSYVKIENPIQTCKEHYDIWYFIDINKNNFHPDQNLLDQEFYSTQWADINTAKTLCRGQYSYQALEFIEQKYFKNLGKK